MSAVQVFLRTELFSLSNSPIPPRAMILEGELTSQEHGGLHLEVNQYRNQQGKPLKGTPATLFIPNAKVDYLYFAGDGG
ncbi:MAG: hypothetical protein QGG40_11185 [Myxococcota bacterium]|jgi:hypothetical protein|nr:hypothetical protein [Myxococcota bacterium]